MAQSPVKVHKDNKKTPYVVIGLLSTAICLFIIWLVYFAPKAQSNYIFAKYLPALFTLCNAFCAGFLIRGIILIKRKNIPGHIKSMLTATGFSACFLIFYITYYIFHGDSKFTGIGFIRPIYFSLLISHIVLSVVNLPFVLTTLYHAFNKNYESHKKVAKITFPLWLYVSLSGVFVYLIRTLLS